MSGFPGTGEALTPAPANACAVAGRNGPAGGVAPVTRGEVEFICLPPATDEPTGLVERTRRVLVAALVEVHVRASLRVHGLHTTCAGPSAPRASTSPPHRAALFGGLPLHEP